MHKVEYEYECLDACKKNPLINLTQGSPYTIRDLLLSRTAIGPSVTFQKVTEAIDELISLNYPIINRILEISAHYCAMGLLYIYYTDQSNFESLKSTVDEYGHFNPMHGLIVLSTNLPLSQLLIHELTHAVRYFIGINKNVHFVVKQHSDFCKNEFTKLFSQALVNTQLTSDERKELASMEEDAQEIRQLMVKNRCTMEKWSKIMDSARERFGIRRQNFHARQQFRRNFYDAFKPYQESEYAEEFLPFFLQHFVCLAFHEKVKSLQSWVVDYISVSDEYLTKIYNAKLLDMLWSSLPLSIVKNFVTGNFREALDNHASSIKLYFNKKCITTLEDSEFYSASLSEPFKVNDLSWKI